MSIHGKTVSDEISRIANLLIKSKLVKTSSKPRVTKILEGFADLMFDDGYQAGRKHDKIGKEVKTK